MASVSADGTNSFTRGGPSESSPLDQAAGQGRFNEDFDASRRGSSLVDGTSGNGAVQRNTSQMSQSQTLTPSRGGTLKKRQSLKRGNSLKRSSSRKSLGAGSMKSMNLGDRERYEGSDFYSAFNNPVPTRGSPTEILANRFQDWRRVLKDLISYFREVQKSHEARSKSLLALSNLASNMSAPPGFLKESGLADATTLLKDYHRKALSESNKAKIIEEEIMQQLTGLRSDLGQKTKEIKSLSGDFKNSCEKETEATRKVVRGLQEALGTVDSDPSAAAGKGDPFIVKLGVEKQIERQIDEENYLHKAFLNLEHSGRELESIVVGEIQKAYNAYAGILKREADEGYEIVESLRMGPVMMPKDAEWEAFVNNNDSFVDPRMPLRKPDQITYPGIDAPAAAEVRSGMLERKSKYLKSYTPGWYVLSPTHLHEFKSPDRLSSQAPVMSLLLPEQKLGSHSNPDSSSHKFMLKGRQTGAMHRGHGWVFRAESRDTMLAWYEDIKTLTEKTGRERDAFIRRHARSVSQGSMGATSVSSDGAMDEDEADRVPYSGQSSQMEMAAAQDQEEKPQRPQPGGRFPSDLNIDHHLRVPLSNSSGASSDDREAITKTVAISGEHASDHPVETRQSWAMAPAETYHMRGESYRDEPYPQNDDDLYTSSRPVLTSVTAQGAADEHSHPPMEANYVEHDPVDSIAASYAATGLYDGSEVISVRPQHQKASKILGQDVSTIENADVGNGDDIAPVAFAQKKEEQAGSANQTAHEAAQSLTVDTTSTTPRPIEAEAGAATLAVPLARTPTTPTTTGTTLSDVSLLSTDEVPFGTDRSRPPLVNHESEQTISDLHVPGGYPMGQK